MDNHHIYNVKINMTYYTTIFKNNIDFVYNIIYFYIIYHIQLDIYISNIVYMDTDDIYYHTQPFIYIDHLQYINTINILYQHLPLLYSSIFEYVNIVWHCGEL